MANLATTASKRYKCTDTSCDKEFTRLSSLKSHLSSLKHASVRPYSCAKCGKGFTRKNDYQRHVDSNQYCSPEGASTGKKWHCMRCGKTFGRSSAMHLHERQTKCSRPEPNDQQPLGSNIHNERSSGSAEAHSLEQRSKDVMADLIAPIHSDPSLADAFFVDRSSEAFNGACTATQSPYAIMDEVIWGTQPSDVCSTMVAKRTNINENDDRGYTPLHHAVERYTQYIPMLIQMGADPRIRDRRGLNVFQVAALSSMHAFDELAQHSSKWQERDSNGDTLLHWAAQNNLKELAWRLLAWNASLANTVNCVGDTPIQKALFMKSLYHRYNIGATNSDRTTDPNSDIFAMIKLLLVHGKPTINNKSVRNENALHMACMLFCQYHLVSEEYRGDWNCRFEIVSLLLDNGADATATDSSDRTSVDVVTDSISYVRRGIRFREDFLEHNCLSLEEKSRAELKLASYRMVLEEAILAQEAMKRKIKRTQLVTEGKTWFNFRAQEEFCFRGDVSHE